MLITVLTPHDRMRPGKLSVDDFECACLCRADTTAAKKAGNPNRDPLRRFGDTPTGRYGVKIGPVLPPLRSYGPNPVIRLSALSGQALDATHLYKRSGIDLHGGDLAADGVSLRPTDGCIRVANEDQAEILRRVNAATDDVILEVVEG
jgi:hypothetical protein